MNHKMDYQKPEITLIALECETMISGSNGLTGNSDKEFGGISPANSMSNSLTINLSEEE